MSDEVNHRFLFRDIVCGYSKTDDLGEDLYLKHLSVLDQVNFEEIYNKNYEEIKGRGAPTIEEALARLESEDIWSKNDEAKLIREQDLLKALKNTKANLYLKSEIENINKDIEESEVKANNYTAEKYMLIGPTCEKWADSRVTEHYILNSFYEDKELTKKKFEKETLDELSQKDLIQVISVYNNKFNSLSDLNIQRVILQDFYSIYFPFSDNVSNFFQKPLFELSSNQVKLIVYTRMFKNVFEKHPEVPDAIRFDPEKVVDYVNSQDKAKKTVDNLDKPGASTVPGAKQEDYEYLGVKPQQKMGKSISEMMQEKGGSMDMKDFMEIMG